MIAPQFAAPIASIEVRDQGQRRTCLAFAVCALGHAHSPDPAGLSPEYLYHHAASRMPNWVPNMGVSLAAALAVSSSIALERDCPYQAYDPPSPIPPVPSGTPCFGAPLVRKQAQTALLVSELQQGKAVGLGLMLTDLFYVPVQGRVLDGGSVVPNSQHAVVAVGLGWEADDPFFLIRNSWGVGWGASGCAWISSSYIHQHAICAFGG